MNAEVVYLRVSQWKTRPVHFYGTVRDKEGKAILEVFQCATRRRVIEITKQDLPTTYLGRKFRVVVKRGVELF